MLISDEQASPAALVQRRRQLLDRFDQLRMWWAELGTEENPPCELLCGKFHDLRQLVATHYAAREMAAQNGLLSALTGGGELGADELARTQTLLVADLDRMVSRLRASQPGIDSWAEIAAACESLIIRLKAHEERFPETIVAPVGL